MIQASAFVAHSLRVLAVLTTLLVTRVEAQHQVSWLGDSTKRYQLEYVASYVLNGGQEHALSVNYIRQPALYFTTDLTYADYPARPTSSAVTYDHGSIRSVTLDVGLKIRPPTWLQFLYAGVSAGASVLMLDQAHFATTTGPVQPSANVMVRPTIAISVGTDVPLANTLFWSVRLRKQFFKNVNLGSDGSVGEVNIDTDAIGMGLMIQL